MNCLRNCIRSSAPFLDPPGRRASYLKLDQAKCRDSWKLGSASSRRPATWWTSSRTSRSCSRSRRLQDGPGRAMFIQLPGARPRFVPALARVRTPAALLLGEAEEALARGSAATELRLHADPCWWHQGAFSSLPWVSVGASSETQMVLLTRLVTVSG